MLSCVVKTLFLKKGKKIKKKKDLYSLATPNFLFTRRGKTVSLFITICSREKTLNKKKRLNIKENIYHIYIRLLYEVVCS